MNVDYKDIFFKLIFCVPSLTAEPGINFLLVMLLRVLACCSILPIVKRLVQKGLQY